MQRVIIVALVLILFVWVNTYGQKETNIWYYGFGGGLDFNSTIPGPLFDGKIQSAEASAVVSDRISGKLLFYSDGTQVWDRAHQIMPNGEGLYGITTSTQGALIMPYPGNTDKYYLFTLATPTYSNFTSPGLYYSIIDRRLNGGRGDVIRSSKNSKLLDKVSEKLTAVPHKNGKDYWVITHGWNNDEFYVYLVDNQGVHDPQTYKSGTIHQGIGYNSAAAGYLKASPNGKLLACAVEDTGDARPFELYDFDAETGAITNFRSLGNFSGQYGVSFSPDNSKLYLTLHINDLTQTDSTICQFDLNEKEKGGGYSYQFLHYPLVSGESWASGGIKAPIPLSFALQLGPDGKLYSSSPYVINKPNLKGAACDITTLPPLEGRVNRGFGLGLPNFMQSFFSESTLPKPPEADECALNSFKLYPNPTNGIVEFGVEGDCIFSECFDLEIVNAIGQKVMALKENITYRQVIDISHLSDGLYLFILTFTERRQLIKKVVKID